MFTRPFSLPQLSQAIFNLPSTSKSVFSLSIEACLILSNGSLTTTARMSVWKARASIRYPFGTLLKIQSMLSSQTRSGFLLLRATRMTKRIPNGLAICSVWVWFQAAISLKRIFAFCVDLHAIAASLCPCVSVKSAVFKTLSTCAS